MSYKILPVSHCVLKVTVDQITVRQMHPYSFKSRMQVAMTLRGKSCNADSLFHYIHIFMLSARRHKGL